jgi:hypothetical protein
VQGLPHALDELAAGTAPALAEDPPRPLEERLRGRALVLGGGTEIVGIALAAHHGLLRPAQGAAGVEQAPDRLGVAPGDLVQGPRGLRRLSEAANLVGGLSLAARAELLGELVALGGELLEREAVQPV